MEITGGRCTMTSLSELDEFLAGLTAAKNRFYNAGGHCPAQLVFGELPRVPAELLSSHPGGLQALGDAFHDVAGLDEVGAEFRRRMQIREQAKRLALEADSKEAVKRAMKTSSTPARHWNQGQWVFVYRRGKPGDPLHPVSRWVGPGLVVLQTKSLVWVAMRTRLWRCAPEQLRSADPSEMMGRQLATDPSLGELLRQVTAGSQAKAVDVAREGPPPQEDEAMVHRLQDGPDLRGPAGIPPPGPQQAPQEVLPVLPESLLALLLYVFSEDDSGERSDMTVGPHDPAQEGPPHKVQRVAATSDDATELLTSLFSFNLEDQSCSFMATRNDEVDVKKLARNEQEMFLKSDQVEWEAILKTKAVRVASGAQAQRLRAKYPDRILSSRMVRRKKPTGDLHQWKAKSRWCLHGHADPDTGQLITYAPTPQVESLMLFLQCGLNLGHSFAFCDVKNARLFVINIPVYGLDDAPAAWRETVTRFLVEDMHFTRSLVEPCWYFRHDSKGVNQAQVLVEARFHFGKWDLSEADYAGRRVRVLQDRIVVDQEKYILEQLHPINLAKERRTARTEKLNREEFASLRSTIYRISCVGKECRPEMCGLASIMASRLDQATVEDALVVNRCVNHLRNTAQRPLTIWKMNPADFAFIIISDAGGIGSKHEATDELGLPADATQGAWMVVAAEGLPIGDQKVRASPISWRSSKLKRKVYSTFGGETQAMLQGLAEADWLQVMLRDACSHDVQLRNWRNSLSPHMLVMRSDVEAKTCGLSAVLQTPRACSTAC
ncbi:GIP [Symbiodinium sp. CCMP2592]|nr:GIP [Symbiodinium sp. CCMP2592]